MDEQIGRINAKLRGWSEYFSIGTVSKAYRSIDAHVRQRVRQWLRAKFKVKGSGKTRYPDSYLYQKLRLLHSALDDAPSVRGRTCETPCPKAGCGKTARPV